MTENKEEIYMTDDEIMGLTLADLRELTPEEEMKDNFRRMFQMLGLIYKNQVEINNKLKAG
ncbi:hypothetical protein AGMMS49983_20220 [Clostridia bacterium]|nr:hypothetical protein AGMMS49983_20220 [Clostridia bacterium]